MGEKGTAGEDADQFEHAAEPRTQGLGRDETEGERRVARRRASAAASEPDVSARGFCLDVAMKRTQRERRASFRHKRKRSFPPSPEPAQDRGPSCTRWRQQGIHYRQRAMAAPGV